VLEYDFEESIGYWLSVTTHTYHRAFNDELAPHGITFRQSQVLALLALEGELSQAQLAGKLMIEPPTVVGILDRMEREGLIVRRCCTKDRRRKWISATTEAEPVWKQIVACAQRIRAEATDGLTARELATLKKLLRRVHDNLSVRSPVELSKV
jgi:MarR family transcriptional regulator for hemolysin